jgi:hypothetical protein
MRQKPNNPNLIQKNALQNNGGGTVIAVQRLIQITQSLVTIAEKETQSLLLSDMLAFSILQYEKEKLAERYVAASEEFRSRIEEFRALDRALLNKLERLQKDLGEKTRANNEMMERMHDIAKKKTRGAIRVIQDGVIVNQATTEARA